MKEYKSIAVMSNARKPPRQEWQFSNPAQMSKPKVPRNNGNRFQQLVELTKECRLIEMMNNIGM
jgi:hypothetical protein